MLKTCIICGRTFYPYNNRQNQLTCGDPTCVAERKKQTDEEWKRRDGNMERVRMQKRDYMRRVRGSKLSLEMKEVVPKPLPFEKDPTDYGKEQTQKTLASLPRVKTEL